MIERKIELGQIKDAINFPDYTIKKEDQVESYKKFGEKLLRVIHIQEGKFIKIITVIWK